VSLSNYGLLSLAGAVADAPGTLYVGSSGYGVWKTTNGGSSWSQISTGTNSTSVNAGRNWCMAVDPSDSQTVYTCSGYSAGGIWKSSNGGQDWTDILAQVESDPTVGTNDFYNVAIDPNNPQHILVTSHSNWQPFNGGTAAGVLESTNAGNTWTLHPPTESWGAGHYIFFLGQTDDGSVDIAGQYWILTTQDSGIWRTDNGGTSWTQVATWTMTHGMESMYRSQSTGALYLGSIGEIYRSTDNGVTWQATGAQSSSDGYGGIVGDGQHIWAMLANTGVSTGGPYQWQILPESDLTSAPPFGSSSSHWSYLNQQTFQDGPMSMVYDPVNQSLYASQWSTGLWKFQE
jgi:hypothetical protein